MNFSTIFSRNAAEPESAYAWLRLTVAIGIGYVAAGLAPDLALYVLAQGILVAGGTAVRPRAGRGRNCPHNQR